MEFFGGRTDGRNSVARGVGQISRLSSAEYSRGLPGIARRRYEVPELSFNHARLIAIGQNGVL
jgi:hypothetical protein